MRDLILKNFWLKMFSLVLATVIWFVLNTNQQLDYPQPTRQPQVKEFQCPVTLLVSPTEQKLYKVQPGQVTIKVYGDPGSIAEMSPEDIQAYVNLSARQDTEGWMRVDAVVPKGVSLRSILPEHVYVKPSE